MPGKGEVVDQPQIAYRTIDGSSNESPDSHSNAAGATFARVGPARFADGISALVSGPNPRTISNVVVGEGNPDVENPQGLSAMMYAWGQFIDHDLTLTRSDGVSFIGVTVPAGDPLFPTGTMIPITRAIIDRTTGTNAAHPATALNSVTGWLDASMVYGSDAATAAALRLPDGHMRTSGGDNLPIVNGAFAAGDIRVAENPALTALHSLFLREHNYQVDLLSRQHPDWSGDQLYQQARAIVAAEIAHITYAEFLPHLVGAGAIAPYGGYRANVDPSITLEFAGAAFRFGHSIVSGTTEKLDENGEVVGPEQSLREVFFQPPADFAANTGTAGMLRHLLADPSQAMDARIVEDLRNFLFDPPAAMDLAAINIQRGRDLGLPTLNQTRAAFGLEPYTDFHQITNDPGTVAALQAAFSSVDQIDLWTGGLSEANAPGALVGPTFQRIIATQFANLRDGDRLWFENQGFDATTLNAIEQTTLADIMLRVGGVEHVQDDAFVFFTRHTGTAGGVESEDPDARQLVIGFDGNDTLIGGPQGDFLFAGRGNQTLTGGTGPDHFVFDRPGINALITDFEPGKDVLDFRYADTFDFHGATIRTVHGNAVVQLGGDRIELVGVEAWQLSAEDFVFHSEVSAGPQTGAPSGKSKSGNAASKPHVPDLFQGADTFLGDQGNAGLQAGVLDLRHASGPVIGHWSGDHVGPPDVRPFAVGLLNSPLPG